MKDETPQQQLVEFRKQKNALLRLDPNRAEVRQSADELLREMAQFALAHPEHVFAISAFQDELVDAIPGLNANGQREGAA